MDTAWMQVKMMMYTSKGKCKRKKKNDSHVKGFANHMLGAPDSRDAGSQDKVSEKLGGGSKQVALWHQSVSNLDQQSG
jgi:hypothetical protein